MQTKRCFEVRLIRTTEGEVRPYLLIDGIPSILANLWADDLWTHSKPNTVENYLRDAAIALEWAREQGEALEIKFARLRPLRPKEISSLADKLCSTCDGRPASQSTCTRRLEAIRRFVEFSFEHYIALKQLNFTEQEQAEKNKNSLILKLKKKITHFINQAEPPRYSSDLNDHEFDLLLGAAQPDSPQNPFSTPEIKFRNICIVLLMLETHARRGETVLVELDDVDIGYHPSITIKKPTKSNMQKRKDGASLKTRGRKIPITVELADLLHEYISNYRDKLLQPSRPCTALFVSSKDGRRLSARSINSILQSLANAPGVAIGKRVHPHGIRSSGTNRAKKILDASDLPNLNVTAELAYLGGWAPDSAMIRRYARQSISDRLGDIFRKSSERKRNGAPDDDVP